MVSHDVIAQLRQDITTAEDAGDEAAADRLRADLSSAIDDLDTSGRSSATDRESVDLAGSGAAPQPTDAVRRAAADLGPGGYDGDVDPATNIPGAIPEDVQEPPD